MSKIWSEFYSNTEIITPATNFKCFHQHCPSDLPPASTNRSFIAKLRRLAQAVILISVVQWKCQESLVVTDSE